MVKQAMTMTKKTEALEDGSKFRTLLPMLMLLHCSRGEENDHGNGGDLDAHGEQYIVLCRLLVRLVLFIHRHLRTAH